MCLGKVYGVEKVALVEGDLVVECLTSVNGLIDVAILTSVFCVEVLGAICTIAAPCVFLEPVWCFTCLRMGCQVVGVGIHNIKSGTIEF